MTKADTEEAYFPGNSWERREPEESGFDPGRLQKAVDSASDPDHAGSPPDLGAHLARQNGSKQHDDGVTLGPTKPRGPITGVIVKNGYIAAEWGDPGRVDMTFSVSKSFLSTVCGLAWDRGMIRDLDDRVGTYVEDGGYDSEHNARITWDHSLRQISEWDGTLWDKHYSAGNPNDVLRAPEAPGTYYDLS